MVVFGYRKSSVNSPVLALIIQMTALGGNQLKTTLLLVEDEAALADSLTTEFELENMSVIWAKDGAEALTLFKNNEGKINVIILDWMPPKLDGFSVLRKIRQSSQVPIIMLTARDYIGDKVAGLTGGADDYITKPFEMEELVARVEVALRHNRQAVSSATIFQVDDLLVDTDNKRVQRGEVIMPLTQREYELLVELVAHQDEACSRDDLLAAVWGTDFDGQPMKQLHDRQEQQKLFIMNAAHELRTPIATIRSHAQLIERHGRAHPEIVLKSVNYITEESRQMQQLIEELLQLSRADRLTLDTHLLNLSETVQHLAEKLASAFSQTIEVHVTPNMSVESNESAIEQILDNFVTNAAKYSPADTIIAVNLTRDDDGNAVLAVLDQGAGISAEDKSHVFERFYRSANVRGTVPGTGLGLAIANQLATINNGRIKLRDNQPHGTIAELILPLATTKERHQLNES